MLRALIKKELLHHVASFRYLFTTAVMILLAALAAAVGVEDYALRLETHRGHVDQYRRDLEQIHVYSYLQPVVLRAPEPLSVLDRGIEGRLGNEVQIDVFSIPDAATGSYHSNPFLIAARELDLTTLVRVVLGLLAMLLTYDAVIGEREKRNLELILSHRCERGELLAGKFLGALVALLFPLVGSVAASVAILVRHGDVALDADHWLRVASLTGAYLLYLVLMLCCGLLLSLYAKSAAASLMISMLGWLALVFLVPQAATAIGQELSLRLAPARQTEEALLAERDRILDETRARDPLITSPSGHSSPVVETTWNRGVLRRYGSAAYYDALARYHQLETTLGRRWAERLDAGRAASRRRQRLAEQLTRLLAAASPAHLLERVADSFAGTSIDDHDRFVADARAYRATLIEYLESHQAFGSWRWFTDDTPPPRPWPTLLGLTPDDVDSDNLHQLIRRFGEPVVQQQVQRELASYRDDPARRLQLDDLPPFVYRELEARHALLRVWPEITALILLTLVLAGWSRARIERYPAADGS